MKNTTKTMFNTPIFDLLNKGEIIQSVSAEVRNCDVASLTLSELAIIGRSLQPIKSQTLPKALASQFACIFALEILVERYSNDFIPDNTKAF